VLNKECKTLRQKHISKFTGESDCTQHTRESESLHHQLNKYHNKYIASEGSLSLRVLPLGSYIRKPGEHFEPSRVLLWWFRTKERGKELVFLVVPFVWYIWSGCEAKERATPLNCFFDCTKQWLFLRGSKVVKVVVDGGGS
jgi:hypothetical protein